jgi:hypothetical protein
VPKNGQVEDIVALEAWPDVATEVFMVPSHVKWTSLVPPNVAPVASIIVKLLLVVSTTTVQLLMGVCMQPVAGSHESRVQGLPSSQPIGVWAHPVAGLHESAVQTLLSSQLIGV